MLLPSFLLLITLPLLFASHDRLPIPKSMRSKIAKARNFHTLVGDFRVSFTPNASNHHHHHRQQRPQDMLITGASLLRLPTAGAAAQSMKEPPSQAEQEYLENMAILNKIKQGSDTCKLQKVCIPIEDESNDPSIQLYPMCYDVMRCVGSCCHAENKCHPHTSRNVSRVVVEMAYMGQNRFQLNRTFNITMEEHTSCSCYECNTKNLCAPGLVIGPSCRCECPNQDEKAECDAAGMRTWREDKCKCECPVKLCPSSEVLDEQTCQCVHRDTNLGQAIVVPHNAHATNIANLPKLAAKGHK